MNNKIIIGVFGVFLLVLSLFFLFSQTDNDSSIPKVSFSDWQEEFDPYSYEPQGIGVFKDLAEKYTKDSVIEVFTEADLIKLDTNKHYNFLFIENFLSPEYKELQTVNRFVEKGSNAYYSFNYLNEYVFTQHFKGTPCYWDYSKNVYIWFSGKSYAYNALFQAQNISKDWSFFVSKNIKDSNFIAHKFGFDLPVEIQLKDKKGSHFLHSIPELFKNYTVTRKNGYFHSISVLNHFPKNKQIVLLTGFAKDPSKNKSTKKKKSNEVKDDSLIQFILENPSTRLAFILSLGLLILYVIFRTKRREKVIPTKEKHQNMSLSFVDTLSSIYLSKRNPKGILSVMRTNFFARVSRHFYIDLQRKEQAKLNVKLLAEKSNVPLAEIVEIYNDLMAHEKAVSYAYLGMLNEKIRAFYLKTGINSPSKKFTSELNLVEIHRPLWLTLSIVLFFFYLFVTGLIFLSLSYGLGSYLLKIGGLGMIIGFVFMNLPVIKVNHEEIIRVHLFKRNQRFLMNQGIEVRSTATETIFNFEDGNTLQIQHKWISKRGKIQLTQFIEFIKNKTA